MTKRLSLAVAALAAGAALAAPAAAANPVWVETCYATVQVPCAVCYRANGVTNCIPL